VAAKLKMVAHSKAEGTTAQASRDRGDSLVLDTDHRRVSPRVALGDRNVAYVNDRMCSEAHAGVRLTIPTTGVAQFVCNSPLEAVVDGWVV